jgi:hypothetical protein
MRCAADAGVDRASRDSSAIQTAKGIDVNRSVLSQYLVIVAAMAGASLTQASTLTREDYDAEKTRIEDAYRAGDARCGVLAGHARDACVQDAKFNEKVALANLEYRFTGTKSDERTYMTVKAEADAAVAKEKCEVRTGSDKAACLKEASSARAKSLPDVKRVKESPNTGNSAGKHAQGPDYEVALKRCDGFDGENKTACIVSVKAKFGKS